MMTENKRILIYGDSNSWGYLDDGNGERFQYRWPIEMANYLSNIFSVDLIEECLPARTTNLSDPVLGSSFNGELTLEAILLSRFNRNINDIVNAIIGLAKITRSTPAGRGGWFSDDAPDVSIICPLVIGKKANDPSWDRADEWTGAYEKSLLLAYNLQKACNLAGINMIDGNEFGSSSEHDPIHWDQKNHQRFGQKLAKAIQPLLLD
jgi:lysophospholipase L1-like esterase